MRWLLGAIAAALLVGGVSSWGSAGRDFETAALPMGGQELVVFETRDCVYCGLFRSDILPIYQRSKFAATSPIRFVDMARADTSALSLAAPLTTVPTVVILMDGREAGRVTGYTGPETFFRLIAHFLGGDY